MFRFALCMFRFAIQKNAAKCRTTKRQTRHDDTTGDDLLFFGFYAVTTTGFSFCSPGIISRDEEGEA